MSVIDYFGTGTDAGDNSFLSNFYWDDGWTVEHHYQAAKTDDPDWATRILEAPNPAAAKKYGRKAPMRPTWDDEKVAVMLALLRLKFRSPEMAARLLTTGDAQLVEGNWWGDTFWGVCKGVGENHLGKLLMQVRSECLRRDDA
jgi:ribA/ribD-fused uncharacterized protein